MDKDKKASADLLRKVIQANVERVPDKPGPAAATDDLDDLSEEAKDGGKYEKTRGNLAFPPVLTC